jgi:hypothetical protein
VKSVRARDQDGPKGNLGEWNREGKSSQRLEFAPETINASTGPLEISRLIREGGPPIAIGPFAHLGLISKHT